MAALVVPGAPVTVLIDHGMTDEVAQKLMEAGVSTVENLGAMTPEQLEEIPGIEQDMVENIQTAVVAYYGQFEDQPVTETAQPETAQTEAAPAENDESISQASETVVAASDEKAPENESDTIENTEVPAAAPETVKGAAELS
jgi:N utilization substance protein A